MNIKVSESRKIYIDTDKETSGTQNENNVTELQIEVPEKYQEFNMKIVFITNNGAFWDIVENNTYKITKAITKYKSVRFYIWLTKEEEDFRSEEKELTFNNNVGIGYKLEQEEIDGINKVLQRLEDIQQRMDTLEVSGYDDTEVKESLKELDTKKMDKEESLSNLEIEEILNL